MMYYFTHVASSSLFLPSPGSEDVVATAVIGDALFVTSGAPVSLTRAPVFRVAVFGLDLFSFKNALNMMTELTNTVPFNGDFGVDLITED